MSLGEKTQIISNIMTVEVQIFNPNGLHISVHSKRGSVTHSSSRPGIRCGLRTTGSDEHYCCSHSRTAQMGVTYIRTVLPADAYGRQRCNVVLSACSVVYLWCMSWAVCSLERATKTYKILPVRTYRVRPHAENPGNCLTHSRRKKTLSACHASCSARMELKPRPTCPDGLPVSAYLALCRKMLVRRDMFE